MSARTIAITFLLAAMLAGVSFTSFGPRPTEADEHAIDLAALFGPSTFGPSTALARIGGQPPPFTLPAAVGGPSTAQFRMGDQLSAHHPVAILFWATWCVPCTQELTFYETLYQRHRAQDFHVVAINMDTSTTVTRAGPAARRLGVTFDVVTDLDTRVTSQLNPRRSAPFSIWVSREGRITWEMEGFSPAQHATVESGIRDLVAGATPPPAPASAPPSAPPPAPPPAPASAPPPSSAAPSGG